MSLEGTVCASCGVPVSQSRIGNWLHIEELPENVEGHDVDTVISRRDYLFGTQAKAAEARIPQEYQLQFAERQAIALERMASALERIATRLDT